MPYALSYEEAGFVRLIYEGAANLKDLKKVISKGVALAMEKKCIRVLSDFRRMELNLSMMDLYSIPMQQIAQARELNVSFSAFRRAVVVPDAAYDKYKFFENVAVNRAHTVKVFVEMEKAVAWLLQG